MMILKNRINQLDKDKEKIKDKGIIGIIRNKWNFKRNIKDLFKNLISKHYKSFNIETINIKV